MKELSGKYHIFFYKTTSAMDIEYYGDTMKFITIGGIMHFKLFFGDYDPESAIKIYHSYLNKWSLHPFW